MELVRLNKFVAHRFGISRREADTRIEQGRVLVNGKIATLGNVINPLRDQVTLDNAPAASKKRSTYLLLNKPVGYVCSRKKQGDNPTIYDLLPREYQHLKVAGRLDKDSCGLLLLTDDGDAIFKLTHPKFKKEKVYVVGLNKPLKPEDKKLIDRGVELEDGISKLQITGTREQISKTANQKPNLYKVTMHEGRNRQIRRTFKALGYTVTFLERINLGIYKLEGLKPGEFVISNSVRNSIN